MFRKRLKNMDPRWKAYALAGCICVLFYVLLTNIKAITGAVSDFFGLFQPVVLGAVIAYIVTPLANLFDGRVLRFLKKEKARWVISVILTFIIVLAMISTLLATLIPQLIDSIQSLIGNISIYIENLVRFSETLPAPLAALLEPLTEFLSDAQSPLARLGQLISENLQTIIAATSDIGGRAVNVGISSVIAIYFLFSKKSIRRTFGGLMRLLIPQHAYDRVRNILDKFNTIFSKYISCELLDMLIIGILNFIVMVIFRMPDALVISVLVAVTNLAPTFGPLVGAAIAGLIILLVKPSSLLPFLILTLVLQGIDAYILKPKLFGGVLDVPGVLILVSIIVFGRMWGIVGVLLAIPVAAIIVYAYEEFILPWLKRRREGIDSAAAAAKEQSEKE